MKEYEFGWEKIKAFESKKDSFIIDKRWPTINLKLTPEQEKKRFGTTGVEMAQRVYLAKHWDGTQMRMFVFIKIERAAGVRNIYGWRAEKNPLMPREYLDPAYPEEKKEGGDWKLLMHFTYPSDIRGAGYVIHSYNNKKKDQDTWVWFPNLRKVRRVTPSAGGDSLAGTYKSFAEGFLRRIPDEVHQIIGETKAYAFCPVPYYESLSVLEKCGPLTSEYMRTCNSFLLPRECWVIRSLSVRGGYCDYYHTRVWLADKEWGYGPIIEEMYNKDGRLVHTHIWPWTRISSYDGQVVGRWCFFAEDLNFEERGFSHWAAPQTNFGYENPDEWFTLRELTRSVPTIDIPYMAVLPPKNLLPIEDLFPGKELQDAYKKHFPERLTSFPDAESVVGLEED